jgi:hypothetical protein
MKTTASKVSKLMFAVGVIGVAAVALQALAAGPARPGSGCPRRGIYCLDVYQPVECTTRFGTRAVYSNGCYAYIDCATNCTDASAY